MRVGDVPAGVVVEWGVNTYLRIDPGGTTSFKFVCLSRGSELCEIPDYGVVRVVDCTLVKDYKGEKIDEH
jgi:hypothetical protein